MHNLRTISFLLFGCALAVASAQEWKKKDFPGWSEDTVLRLVSDSPWAKQKTVNLDWHKRSEQPLSPRDIPGADPTQKPIGSPVGGIGVPRQTLPYKADILIRWASALPVRQATALYKQRDGKLDASKLNELVGPPDPDYVLEIYGLPTELAHKGAGSLEHLAVQSSYLRTEKGQTIKPARAQVTLNGPTLTIFIHFPRTAAIRPEDQEILCYGDFQIFEIKERFRLSQMMYLGHLEL
jgi:hypothetical protein